MPFTGSKVEKIVIFTTFWYIGLPRCNILGNLVEKSCAAAHLEQLCPKQYAIIPNRLGFIATDQSDENQKIQPKIDFEAKLPN